MSFYLIIIRVRVRDVHFAMQSYTLFNNYPPTC